MTETTTTPWTSSWRWVEGALREAGVGRGALAFLAAALVFWATRGVPADVAALPPEVWESSPWLVADQAWRLYLLLPAAVVAAFGVWLAPGLWLVAAFSHRLSLSQWILRGFLVAFGVQATGTAALALLSSGRVSDDLQLATGIGLGIVCGGIYALKRRRTAAPDRPSAIPAARGFEVAILVGLAWFCTASLLPALFWLDLTGDGMEVLEIGRSLGWFATPRGLIDVRMGAGAGMFSVGYPIRWLQAAWSPIAATARLPLVLYVPVLYAAARTLVEYSAPRRLRRIEALALACAVAVVAIALALNASYNPYMADPGSPTALSLLTAILLLGTAGALLGRQTGWFFGFFVAGLLTRPTILPFALFVALGAALIEAKHRRWYLGHGTAALVAAVAFGWLVETAFRLSGAEVSYDSSSLIDRFRFLRLVPLDRLRFVLAPLGVIPALALLAWGKQDAVARSLTIAAALYFALVAFPAFVALHHFVPVMLLPLVVFWRVVLVGGGGGRRWTVAAFAAVALAGVLVLPPRSDVPRVFRSLGERTAITVGDYGSDSWDEHVAALRIFGVIGALLQADRLAGDPTTELITQLQLPFYARAEPDEAEILFHPAGADPPGWIPLGEADGVVVAVRSLEDWRRMRATVPSTEFQSPWLRIPGETLFAFIGVPAGNYDLDLASLPVLWRLF
ncbi:MAG: hypothetical protein RLN75_02170 [Longimicrobiales bacterium]